MDVLQVSAQPLLRSSLFLHATTYWATVYLLTSFHDVTVIVMNTCKTHPQNHQLISKTYAVTFTKRSPAGYAPTSGCNFRSDSHTSPLPTFWPRDKIRGRTHFQNVLRDSKAGSKWHLQKMIVDIDYSWWYLIIANDCPRSEMIQSCQIFQSVTSFFCLTPAAPAPPCATPPHWPVLVVPPRLQAPTAQCHQTGGSDDLRSNRIFIEQWNKWNKWNRLKINCNPQSLQAKLQSLNKLSKSCSQAACVINLFLHQ